MSAKKRPYLLVLLVIVALGVLIGALRFYLSHPSQRVSMNSGVGTTAAAATAADEISTSSSLVESTARHGGLSRPVRRASLPLPPSDEPVMDSYRELAKRARGGDAHAACRLAVDLRRCQQLSLAQGFAKQQERSITDPLHPSGMKAAQLDDTINRTAQTKNFVAQFEPFCAGVDPLTASQAFDWQLRAAELGHAPSMLAFVREPALPFNRELADLDRLRVYRDRAQQFAQTLLLAGNRDIVHELSEAYLPNGSGNSMLGRMLPGDPVKAYGYYLLAKRLSLQSLPESRPVEDDSSNRFRGGLSSADVARAEAVAADLYAQNFARAPPPSTSVQEEEKGPNDGDGICGSDN